MICPPGDFSYLLTFVLLRRTQRATVFQHDIIFKSKDTPHPLCSRLRNPIFSLDEMNISRLPSIIEVKLELGVDFLTCCLTALKCHLLSFSLNSCQWD